MELRRRQVATGAKPLPRFWPGVYVFRFVYNLALVLHNPPESLLNWTRLRPPSRHKLENLPRLLLLRTRCQFGLASS